MYIIQYIFQLLRVAITLLVINVLCNKRLYIYVRQMKYYNRYLSKNCNLPHENIL